MGLYKRGRGLQQFKIDIDNPEQQCAGQQRMYYAPSEETRPWTAVKKEQIEPFGQKEKDAEEMGPSQGKVGGGVKKPPEEAPGLKRPEEGISGQGGEQKQQSINADFLAVVNVDIREGKYGQRNKSRGRPKQKTAEEIEYQSGEHSKGNREQTRPVNLLSVGVRPLIQRDVIKRREGSINGTGLTHVFGSCGGIHKTPIDMFVKP